MKKLLLSLLLCIIVINSIPLHVASIGAFNPDDYPPMWKNAEQDSVTDRWGMDNRECVSWVAWKVYRTFGHMYWWAPGLADARQWPLRATEEGLEVSNVPKIHSVGIKINKTTGHAIWVEKINKDGTIHVSQYNADGTGHYSESDEQATVYQYIYFKN